MRAKGLEESRWASHNTGTRIKLIKERERDVYYKQSLICI